MKPAGRIFCPSCGKDEWLFPTEKWETESTPPEYLSIFQPLIQKWGFQWMMCNSCFYPMPTDEMNERLSKNNQTGFHKVVGD